MKGQNIQNDEALEINDNYQNWLGVSQEKDAMDTINAIKGIRLDWVIVDHYALGEIWEKRLRSFTKNIFVIDDLANREHSCDILLDQNWFINFESRYKHLVPKDCVKLLGPEYALLRPQFEKKKKHTFLKEKRKLNRIFIFFGGTDPHNLTSSIVKILLDKDFDHIELDIVIGEKNLFQTEIKNLIRNRAKTNLHIQVNNIASILYNADLAIASGGINTWERICCLLNTLVITTAENQTKTIKDLHYSGYVEYIGSHDSYDSEHLKKCIKDKMTKNDSSKLKNLGIDGLGSRKVIEQIINYKAINNVQ